MRGAAIGKRDSSLHVSEEVNWADKQMVCNYSDRKCHENKKTGHEGDHSKYAYTNREMLGRHKWNLVGQTPFF